MKSAKPIAAAIILIFCTVAGYCVFFYKGIEQAASGDLVSHTERSRGYYTVIDENEEILFTTGLMITAGDEYISADDTRYVIERVHEDTAIAKNIGIMELLPALPVTSELAAGTSNVIAIYHTHSGESYVPTDGAENIPGKGGILRVGATMAKELNKQNFDVVHDDTSHDPHDAHAYDRSRRTASQLMKKKPVALFDVHRMRAAYTYLAEIDGKEVAQCMVVVGRQNPKMQANLEFARRLKDGVNTKYPGLIKGIFLGNGNFNQDLFERLLLLEIGSEKTSRQAAEAGVSLIASAVPRVLSDAGGGKESRGAGRAIGWLLGLVVAGVFVYLWISTGSWEEMKAKILGWFGTGGIKIGGGKRNGAGEGGGNSG